MRALLQRVTEASVSVTEELIGQIGPGWLVLLGVARGDDESVARALAQKVVGLRCFADAQGKTNLSAVDVQAECLVVSQFTLYADLSRGRRPGFSSAALPAEAQPRVEQFVEAVRGHGLTVKCGRFGATMRVSLVNDGPFTIWLDSDDHR